MSAEPIPLAMLNALVYCPRRYYAADSGRRASADILKEKIACALGECALE